MIKKDQVFEIMSMFRDVYNNFDFDQQKLNTWHSLLKNQDLDTVLKNAERLVLESKFPPSLAELLEVKKDDNSGWEINHEHLSKMRERRKDVYDDPGF